MKKKKNSIRTQILEMYSSIWIPFFIMVILAFYLILSSQLEKQAILNLTRQSYNCQIYAMRYLKTLDSEEVEDALQTVASHFANYMSDNSHFAVEIYGAKGLLAESEREEEEIPLTKDVLQGTETKAYSWFWKNGVRYVSFSSPVYFEQQDQERTIGSIRFVYPMNEEYRLLFSVLGSFGVICVAVLFFLSFITKKMAEGITDSLNELKESVAYAQKGNFSREVNIESNDEIEELGDAFNSMQRQLRQYIEKLDSQSHQMQQFFNNAAHQLKTPLTCIIGYSQMMQVSNSMDEVCEDAFIIEEAGEKLLHSIEVMIATSKKEIETVALHISDRLLYSIIQDCLQILKGRCAKLGIELENTCFSDISVRTDGEILKEIILNLLDNAIIHSGCSKIRIWAKRTDNVVQIHVADNGSGIKKEDADYIFTAFYQGQQSVGKGSGLGLSICAAKAEQIKGTVELISVETQGAEFVITVPDYVL